MYAEAMDVEGILSRRMEGGIKRRIEGYGEGRENWSKQTCILI